MKRRLLRVDITTFRCARSFCRVMVESTRNNELRSQQERVRLNLNKIKPPFFFFNLSMMIQKLWDQLPGNPAQSLI